MKGEENRWGHLRVRWHPGDSDNVQTVVPKLGSHKLHAPSRRGGGLAKYSLLIAICVSGCQALTPEAWPTHH